MAFAAPDAAQLAALAAFAGHCFPVWLRFQGGKGVATFLGILLAIAWPVGIAACLTWLVTHCIAHFIALGIGCRGFGTNLGGTAWVFNNFRFGRALALLIFYRHSANISRIIAGTEPKLAHQNPDF